MQDLYVSLRRTALSLFARLDFLPPLLARVVIGVVFVQSGWGKLHSLDKMIAFFTELGIPAPQIQAPFVAGTELVCGALVLVGLVTRLASIPLIGTMVVAIATAQWESIDGLNSLFGTVEFLYIALLVALVIRGAGQLSIDAILARHFGAGVAQSDSRGSVGPISSGPMRASGSSNGAHSEVTRGRHRQR